MDIEKKYDDEHEDCILQVNKSVKIEHIWLRKRQFRFPHGVSVNTIPFCIVCY